MFRHYRVILRELVINALPSYTSISNAAVGNTLCPTRYRNRNFFNNFTTNEDTATKFGADYIHIPLHFSHTERTPVQISLQYLHWR